MDDTAAPRDDAAAAGDFSFGETEAADDTFHAAIIRNNKVPKKGAAGQQQQQNAPFRAPRKSECATAALCATIHDAAS